MIYVSNIPLQLQLAVSINADPFQFYSSGIISCSNKNIDHAILLIGYGTENGQNYWLIKNQWGESLLFYCKTMIHT